MSSQRTQLNPVAHVAAPASDGAKTNSSVEKVSAPDIRCDRGEKQGIQHMVRNTAHYFHLGLELERFNLSRSQGLAPRCNLEETVVPKIELQKIRHRRIIAVQPSA